jgi:predicted TIM-barrel fold metal-dependent hydrolase
VTIIDADGHLFEHRDMWVKYCDPRDRDIAISIVDDDLGYPWLTFQGATVHGAMAFVSDPGARNSRGGVDTSSIGDRYQACYAGIPATASYEELMVPAAYDPAARRDILDDWAVDEAILFPQWGLDWESLFFQDNIPAIQANAAAWNRWAVDVMAEGRGKLHPVGHVTLQGDHDWLYQQLGQLAEAGIRMVMFTPGLVNGRRPSHPDFDPIWSAFVDHGLTVTHHVTSGTPYMIDRAWIDNDNPFMPAIALGFYQQQVRLPLIDMAVNGVFQRHPDLRVALIEEGALLWLENLLLSMDFAFDFTAKTLGRSVNPSLELRPSEYIRRHCRFGALLDEDSTMKTLSGDHGGGLLGTCDRTGDVFCFGGDWPHSEGAKDPLRDFRATVGIPEDGARASKLYGDNAAWLLQRGSSTSTVSQ